MRVGTKISVNFEAVLHLTEPEIRALDALIGYGFEPFVKAFYEKLGQTYMCEHESGLRTLFESIEKQVRPSLHRMDQVKEILREKLKEEQLVGGKFA